MSNLTFVHLTDLHVLASEDDRLHNQPTFVRVRNVMERIHALEINPAFFVVSGDLVNNGTVEEYQLVMSLLDQMRDFGCPVLVGLGNHDARLPFRQVILNEPPLNAHAADETRRYYHSEMIEGLNVIMLDTVIHNETGGNVDAPQLQWLAQELEREAAVGHLIVMHHPPVYSTVTWLNSIGLENAADLAEVVRDRNVLGVLSGHIHYAHTAQFAGVLSFTSPATAYMIDPGAPDNLRATDGSGFAIGTIHRGQLYMNSIMVRPGENEVMYREINQSEESRTQV